MGQKGIEMKKIIVILLSALMLSALCGVSASAAGGDGILYQLDLSAASLEQAGLKIAPSSAATFQAEIADGALSVSADSGKGFIIFDGCDALADHDSYLIEYTFSFTSALDETGYLCYMFRCDGPDATNTQDFNFRYNGTNNKFGPENSASMRANIAAGKTVKVTIPIIDRYVEDASVTVEGETNELTRNPLVSFDEGGKPGLIVKNVSARLYSLVIRELPGEGETAGEVSGAAAPVETTSAPVSTSVVTSDGTAAESAPAAPVTGPAAPVTGDNSALIIGAVLALAAAAAAVVVFIRKKTA